MKIKIQEIIALLLTVSSLVALPIVVFNNAPWVEKEGTRIIHLTALQKGGVWTDQKVNGLNYWWKDYKPATLRLVKGEKVILRLTSADVTHTFYVPDLYPEPVIVKGGYTEDLVLIPEKTGEFTYYCTTVCGECHYFMQGKIVVELKSDPQLLTEVPDSSDLNCEIHIMDAFSSEYSTILEEGKYLYEKFSCYSCHGKNGAGEIHNPNYVNGSVPQLNTIAERMKIYYKEDVDILLDLLNQKVDLFSLEDEPPVENFSRFLAQYSSIRDKINHGSPDVQKRDISGPVPPLNMPSWKNELSDHDISAIIAYMLSEYPWEYYAEY